MPTAIDTSLGVAHTEEPPRGDNLATISFYGYQDARQNGLLLLRCFQALTGLVPADKWFTVIGSVFEVVNGDFRARYPAGDGDNTTPVHELLVRFLLPALHRAGYDTYGDTDSLVVFYRTNCGASGCPCAVRGDPAYVEPESDDRDFDDEEDDEDDDI